MVFRPMECRDNIGVVYRCNIEYRLVSVPVVGCYILEGFVDILYVGACCHCDCKVWHGIIVRSLFGQLRVGVYPW